MRAFLPSGNIAVYPCIALIFHIEDVVQLEMEINFLNEVCSQRILYPEIIQEIGVQLPVLAGGIVNILFAHIIGNKGEMQVVDHLIVEQTSGSNTGRKGNICCVNRIGILVNLIVRIIPVVPVVYVGYKIIDLVLAEAGVDIPGETPGQAGSGGHLRLRVHLPGPQPGSPDRVLLPGDGLERPGGPVLLQRSEVGPSMECGLGVGGPYRRTRMDGRDPHPSLPDSL